MKTSASVLLASALTAIAAPTIEKRAINDLQILNYALTLEHLEATFYREALAKFKASDFAAAGHPAEWFYKNLQEVAADEKTHVAYLTKGIKAAGGHPVAECNYDFGYTDVSGFLQTAAILEGVGVTAYLGAAGFIKDKSYLGAAGSILTVEARHSSHIRAHIHRAPYPAPFDVPMDFNEVYSLASQFITGCPNNPPNAELPALMAFPVLAASTAAPVSPGDSVQVSVTKALKNKTVYYTWMDGAAMPTYGTATSKDGKTFTVKVPASGVNGQSFVVLTSSKGAFSDDNVLAGPAIFEVTAAFNGLA